jgi:cell division protein FtsZ
MAAQHAANSPLLETNINGAKRLLVNVTAGTDFSIGEAHEAMEYILQFADVDDADIIMGHVMRDNADGEVQITLLAAGMSPEGNSPPKPRQDVDVFTQPAARRDAPEAAVGIGAPIQLDEIDLDIPTFLRRQRGG